MKSLTKICLAILTVLTLAAFNAGAQTNAAGTNAAPHPRPAGARYNGTVSAVDATAKTFTITMKSGQTRVYHVTSKTTIKKDGDPATFTDIAEGVKVRGAVHKDDSGDLIATTVLIGEVKPKASATPPASSPAAPDTK